MVGRKSSWDSMVDSVGADMDTVGGSSSRNLAEGTSRQAAVAVEGQGQVAVALGTNASTALVPIGRRVEAAELKGMLPGGSKRSDLEIEHVDLRNGGVAEATDFSREIVRVRANALWKGEIQAGQHDKGSEGREESSNRFAGSEPWYGTKYGWNLVASVQHRFSRCGHCRYNSTKQDLVNCIRTNHISRGEQLTVAFDAGPKVGAQLRTTAMKAFLRGIHQRYCCKG